MATQATHSSQRILLPVKPWFIAVTLMAGFFLNLVPSVPIPGLPDALLFALAFWCIREPRRVGMGIAFSFGILMDVADASLLGQHALAYVVLAFIAQGLSRRVLWFPLWLQALHILPLFLFAELLKIAVGISFGAPFPGMLYLLGPLVATLLWTPLTYLLLMPQYQPIERDETRPI